MDRHHFQKQAFEEEFLKNARIFEPGFMFGFMHAGVWARARGLRSNVRPRKGRGVVAMSEMMSLDSSNGSDSADLQQIFEVQNYKKVGSVAYYPPNSHLGVLVPGIVLAFVWGL